ncbi:hypothetical protein DFJ74DRAFT_675930 [Hyaloraphidium curvatum]|nr:hypothetical protein DFJ74DRAFT_675930 [Hyaloraphidium curvatum]
MAPASLPTTDNKRRRSSFWRAGADSSVSAAMGDNTYVQLEAMLPELDDLLQKGLFTKTEIKAIVKKRKEHEFALARRISKKPDFLRYIDYETNLEQLRKKRKERILAALAATDERTGKKKERPQWKGSVSDHSIRQRIHFIFARALKKFPGDVDLWVQYLDWAESVGANKALGRAYARAVQLHPAKPVFWVKAAMWELESNTNISAARVLLQRAIRMNPELHELWHEYFKLELRFLDKIRARREILFGKKSPPAGESACDGDQDMKDADSDDEDAGSDADDGVIKLPSGPADNETEALAEDGAASSPTVTENAMLDGAIPRIVYRNAVRAIPGDLQFRARFLELFQSASLRSGVEEVLDSVRRDFWADPEAVEVVAASELLGVATDNESFPSKLRASIAVFQEAIRERPSAELYSRFFGFLRDMRTRTDEPNLVRYLNILLLRACRAAEAASMLTEEGYAEWAADTALLSEGDESADDVVARGVAALPAAAGLWKLRMEADLSGGSVKDWRASLKAALRKLDRAQSWPVWEVYLNKLTSAAENVDHEDVEAAMKEACGRHGLQGTASDDLAVSRYLDWARDAGGVEKLRSVVDALIRTKTRSAAFYERCLRGEIAGSVAGSPIDPAFDWNDAEFVAPRDISRLRRYFEGTLDSLRTDHGVWLSYIKFELGVAKDLTRAAALYDKASRVVRDRDEFDRLYLAVKRAL